MILGKKNILNEFFTSVFTVDTDFEGGAKMVLDQYILPQKIS